MSSPRKISSIRHSGFSLIRKCRAFDIRPSSGGAILTRLSGWWYHNAAGPNLWLLLKEHAWPEDHGRKSMNRNIVIVVIVVLLPILAYYFWAGRGTAPVPATTTTTPADTTQPATTQ
jgi:hypothetical protein